MSPALMAPRVEFLVCLCDDGRHDALDVIETHRALINARQDVRKHYGAVSWAHIVQRTEEVTR